MRMHTMMKKVGRWILQHNLKQRPLARESFSSKETRSESMATVLSKGFDRIGDMMSDKDVDLKSKVEEQGKQIQEQNKKFDLLTAMLCGFIRINAN